METRTEGGREIKDLVNNSNESLSLLKRRMDLAKLNTLEAKQIACDELFTNKAKGYKVYEALKFLMLNMKIRRRGINTY